MARPIKKEVVGADVVGFAEFTDADITDLLGVVSWNDLTDKPATFPPSVHDHNDLYYTEAESDAALAAGLATKSDVGHIHDDRYYTEAEIDAQFAAIDRNVPYADSNSIRADIDLTIDNEVPYADALGARNDIVLVA